VTPVLPDGRGHPISVARAVAQFALSGLAALILVAVAGTIVLRESSRKEEIREASALATVAGEGFVEPVLEDAIVNSRPDAVRKLDQVVREHVKQGDVVRVKLWSRDGRIVYSDEKRLIRRKFHLGADELDVFDNGGVVAELSDLTRPENQYELQEGKLLEVYLPVQTKGGKTLMFELYLKFSSVVAGGRRTWRAVAPGFLAALALLALVQIPLAWSMARQLRDRQRERENLLVRALESSDAERRRIAGDLHDGVVQDLAGVTYSLAAAAERPEGLRPDEAESALREGAAATRRSMRRLRSLLVEIYPPRLHEAGLEAALIDLVTPLVTAGIHAHVDVQGGAGLSPEVERFVFRAAQEALRNVNAHSGASTVDVRVTSDGERVALIVEDDGRGFAAESAARRRGEGHFGLSLLADLAADLGGSVDVRSEPGGGTRVQVEVPAR
jgi:two-component system, NarL family, sensor kinase